MGRHDDESGFGSPPARPVLDAARGRKKEFFPPWTPSIIFFCSPESFWDRCA